MKTILCLFILPTLTISFAYTQSNTWEDSAAVYLTIVKENLTVSDSLQLSNADKAEQFASRSNNDSLLTMAWYYKGIVYYYAGFHEVSNEYYFKALQRPEAVVNPNMQYGILNNIGINYDLLGKPVLSLNFYHKALKIAEAQSNYKGIGQVNINLGRLYRVTKDYNKSEFYLREALTYFESVKDTFYIGLACQNMFSLLAEMGNNESEMMKAFARAMENYQAINYSYGIAELYHNLALYYEKNSGDQNQIRNYYQKALKISQEAGTHSNSASVMLALARLAMESGNYQQAEKLARESLHMSTKQHIPRERNHALKLLVKIYLALNEKEKGTEAFQEQIALSDSLFDSEKAKSFNELSILHDLKYKNQLIQNQQLEIDNNRLYSTWLKSLLAAAVLAIILLLLFYRFRAKKLRQQYELNLELMNKDVYQSVMPAFEKSTENQGEQNDHIGYIYQRILDFFATEKPYTDSGLSINAIAESLNTNQNYISRAINEHSGMNFYYFLNKYRIAEARKLIEENGAYGFSLEQIMLKSGFRSRSVFIEAFKKFTGMTPGQFLKFARESKTDFHRTISKN
ncbi:MAG: tetratricopeptide repeat protein [Bacteroidetes bacterium]|nr:tetratricopeptide repeat protein [Bacteroidota bacterium]MBU1580939.1 tetratricopeptide repeat protein [Bacteroidota bacterium]MBU2557016.1 tetratricopeptide repeat protein [Bacteroidota bacterium]